MLRGFGLFRAGGMPSRGCCALVRVLCLFARVLCACAGGAPCALGQSVRAKRRFGSVTGGCAMERVLRPVFWSSRACCAVVVCFARVLCARAGAVPVRADVVRVRGWRAMRAGPECPRVAAASAQHQPRVAAASAQHQSRVAAASAQHQSRVAAASAQHQPRAPAAALAARP
jgi:hypothetical protein